MQAGEAGVLLEVYANADKSTGPVNLIGSTCVLCVVNTNGTENNLSMTVSVDGSYAYRLTETTDFPVGGQYQYQLVATYPGVPPVILKSVPQFLQIGWAFC